MIPIALPEKFGCLAFISRVEVCNMIVDSSKPKKLRNAYTFQMLFRWINLIDHTFKIRLAVVQKVSVIEVPGWKSN